jgi:hypothetical protein
MSKKKIFILVLFIIISGISSSCFLFLSDIPIVYDGPVYDDSNDNSGFMLVQYGNFLYKLGGYDSDGLVTDSVSKAAVSINNDGEVQIGEWSAELPLLLPRAHGAAFAVGNYIYVIGGEDENGPVSTVFVAHIDSDGILGNGRSVKYWSTQNIVLPEPRSHMSLAYSDGRVFLVGGKNNDKIFDTILQARLQIGMSGHIGHWNTAPAKLPNPLYDTSVIIKQDKLYVAGGISNINISNSFFSYKINKYGRLSDRTISIYDIPKYLIKPVIVSSQDSVIIGGGYTNDGENNSSWYENSGSKWNLLDYHFSGEGPTSAQVADNLIVLDYNQNSKLIPINLELQPKQPNIYPGSGFVRTNSNIIWEANSWNKLSYSNSLDSNEYLDIPASLVIGSDSLFQFKNTDGDNFSIGIPQSYKVSSIGTFLALSGRLTLEESAIVPLPTLTYDEFSWYQLALYVKKDVLIQWDDSVAFGLTSPVAIALFEEDFCTEVLDNDGFPIAEPSAIDTERSGITEWQVSLNPGTYYLKITGASDTSNAKIGFLISEDV